MSIKTKSPNADSREWVKYRNLVIPILLLFLFVHSAGAEAPGWMFRADPQHTGVYDNGGILPSNSNLWNFTTGDDVDSSPAVANGVVYFGSLDKRVYALNAATGAQIWNFTTGNSISSSPAVANGVVYIGSDDGKVYAINAATGTKIWAFSTGGSVLSSPAVANGIVYIGSWDHKVYAINAATGAQIWTFITGFPVYSSPAVANGVVYIGSLDGKVYALNAVTGAQVWSVTTGSYVYSSPAVANGIVYIGSNDKSIYALNAVTGAQVWKFITGGVVGYSSPAVANGVVYIGSQDNKVYALNAATGTEIWDFTTGGSVTSSPAVANGIVFIGAFESKVYALHAVSGAKIWEFNAGSTVSSSPAVVNGVVYFGTVGDKVYAIGSVPPVASFTAAPRTGTAPLTVQFNDTSMGSPSRWSWEFGDGRTSNVNNPSHTYSRTGIFTVNLTVTNDAGSDYETKKDYITVKTAQIERLVVNFTASPPSGNVPLMVTFNDTSQIPITWPYFVTKWYWDFGDGYNSTSKNVIHAYNRTGNYTVSLKVSGPTASSTITKPDLIHVYPVQKPIADFSANPWLGPAALTVYFNDTSINNPTWWDWNFGDGTPNSTLQNPTHVYTTIGMYTVSLTVGNSEGISTKLKPNYINVGPVTFTPTPSPTPTPPSPVPVANFTAHPLLGSSPLNVTFTDTSTGSPTVWFWQFGDNWFTETRNPDHTYTKPGNYTVTLLVKNDAGDDSEIKTSYIMVSPGEEPPVSADFSGSPTIGSIPLTVSFSSYCPGTPVLWRWFFGDGENSSEAFPVHTYTNPRSYTVSLIMKNSKEEFVLLTKAGYITASSAAEPPHANFTAIPTSGYEPLTVTFSDQSTGNPTSWYWQFGDGENATGENPVHTYESAGNYTVELTVTNSAGYETMIKVAYIAVRTRPVSSDGITLLPGWNFISVPVRLEHGADTIRLFDGVDTTSHTIWTFDGAARKWIAMGAETTVRPLDGIWIYSASHIFVPLYYSDNPLQAPPAKPLAKGWNCIGFGGTVPASARDTFLSAGDDWTQAIGYDAASGQFDTAVVNGGSGAFADGRILYPFRGYWLYASHESELASLGV